MLAVGLMSGTSLDGIDAALVDIEGFGENTQVKLLHFTTTRFTTEMKAKIQRALSQEQSSVALICSLNMELGYIFAEAAKKVCFEKQLSTTQLAFVASHGQTLYHIPSKTENYVPSTLQIGESAVLCEELQTTIVSDFRPRDMSVGGQGAPIVPYSEYILYKSEKVTRLLQNIGGIGNITVIEKGASLEDVKAFDTGPGNMIMDELCRIFYQKEYDNGGAYAKQGKVNAEIVEAMMKHPFIEKKPPKSTGREEFGKEYVEKLLTEWDETPNNWIRTATEFTALSIAESVKQFGIETGELIVGGGGSYNPVLLEAMKQALPSIRILTQEEMGFSSEAKEAVAMTVLGNQTLHHLPSNVPSATGALKAVPLGKITYYN